MWLVIAIGTMFVVGKVGMDSGTLDYMSYNLNLKVAIYGLYREVV